MSQPASQGFQQRLGLFDSTMLVMGSMIGSGIFITSSGIANDVGSAGWLMAVWVLAGIMTILGALSYAELSSMMPKAGGQYYYLKEAYSPMYGFLYGWTCFVVIQTGSIAAVAMAFAKFLGVFVPELGVAAEIPEKVATLTGFMPDLGWEAGKRHAMVIFAATNVKWTLSIPYLIQDFFKMDHFVITAGQLIALLVIVILTWVNCRGVEEGKWIQNILTVSKILALGLLIIVGIFIVADPSVWEMNWSDLWGGIFKTSQFETVAKNREGMPPIAIALMVFGGAMVGALFSADAWNNITFTAGEIRNPKRNVPLSLVLGAGTVIILYLLANIAYIRSLNVMKDEPAVAKLEKEIAAKEEQLKALKAGGKAQEAVVLEKDIATRKGEATQKRGISGARDERVGTAVLELISPTWGAAIMAIAIMISTFGCVNGMILMGGRLYYVMAKEGLFFKSAGNLNRKGVPAVGLIAQAFWSILLLFSGTYNDLLDYVIFAVLVFYSLTVAGLFVLRVKQPNAERPYKAFGYPILPGLYVLLCLAVMVDLLLVKPQFTWPGLILVLAGVPVYFIWRVFYKAPTSAS